MTEKPLVVQGGTLIDGTGRAPVADAVIVIEKGRFKSVGKSGEVAIPQEAQILDAKGKTVLPGFIDGHGHLEDFHGELYLHLGITTCVSIEVYQDGPWSLAQKQGTELGKIRGPRNLDVGARHWGRAHRNRRPGFADAARQHYRDDA